MAAPEAMVARVAAAVTAAAPVVVVVTAAAVTAAAVTAAAAVTVTAAAVTAAAVTAAAVVTAAAAVTAAAVTAGLSKRPSTTMMDVLNRDDGSDYEPAAGCQRRSCSCAAARCSSFRNEATKSRLCSAPGAPFLTASSNQNHAC